MQDTARTRKRLTSAQRKKILEDHRQTQLTDKAFAAQAGVSVSALYAWRRKAAAEKPDASFVAVPNLLSPAPAAPAYRLQWPGGLSLEVRPGFSSQELAALLQLLPVL
jgi:transposase-like protein